MIAGLETKPLIMEDDMRGSKAKRLRKEIYGDTSLRIERKYCAQQYGVYIGSTRVNHPDSLRAIYQQAKKSI